MEEQKSFNSSLTSRIWKIGTLTTGVSTNIIGNKIKNTLNKNSEVSEFELNNEVAKKIVKVLGELKGPWMKIGQYMSLHDTYQENTDFFELFSALQFESPSMSFYFTKMQIEKELGKSPDLIFKTFNRKPIGAASIGQVHEAFLRSGEKVAVKVQYPDMAKIIKSDLTTLKVSLTPFKMFMSKKITPIIDEIQTVLLDELDYRKEAQTMDKFRDHYKDNEYIIIPEYIPELSTEKVLTMKFIDGKPLEQTIKENNLTQEERNHIGRILLHSLWHQLFKYRIIHADPHPGNFLLVDNDKMAILDFGCTKEYPEDFMEIYRGMVKAILERDSKTIRESYIKFGFVSEDETEKLDALEKFSVFMALPYDSKEHFDLNNNMEKLKEGHKEFRKMAEKVGFRLPKDFVYLNRTLFGIGMLLFKLRVNLNFYEEIKKYL